MSMDGLNDMLWGLVASKDMLGDLDSDSDSDSNGWAG